MNHPMSMKKTSSLNRRLWLPTVLAAVVIGVVAVTVSLQTRDNIEAGRQIERELNERLDRAARWAALTEANAARGMTVLASTDTSLGGKVKADMEATSAPSRPSCRRRRRRWRPSPPRWPARA